MVNEGFVSAFDQPAAPNDLARPRIVDQSGIPVCDYGFCSRFLVKL
jgi:hypothetical protein